MTDGNRPPMSGARWNWWKPRPWLRRQLLLGRGFVGADFAGDGWQRRRQSVRGLPPLGGPPQRVSISVGATSSGATSGDIAWSSSGAFFVFTGPGRGLFAVSAEGGEAHQLTKPTTGDDVSPSISPDSGALAFVRRTSTFNSGVLMMSLNRDGTAGGSAKKITAGVWDISPLDLNPGGPRILF